MSIMQPTTLKRTLCSCEAGLLERLIIPCLPKWIDSPKLRALWMSCLHLSSVRHTAGLCLSPLRTGSGMPPTWIESRPGTDGPTASQACRTCQRLWLCCIKDPLWATAWIHNLNGAIFGWHQRLGWFGLKWLDSNQIKPDRAFQQQNAFGLNHVGARIWSNVNRIKSNHEIKSNFWYYLRSAFFEQRLFFFF